MCHCLCNFVQPQGHTWRALISLLPTLKDLEHFLQVPILETLFPTKSKTSNWNTSVYMGQRKIAQLNHPLQVHWSTNPMPMETQMWTTTDSGIWCSDPGCWCLQKHHVCKFQKKTERRQISHNKPLPTILLCLHPLMAWYIACKEEENSKREGFNIQDSLSYVVTKRV